MASALGLDDPVAMIDTEGDEDPQEGPSSAPEFSSKPTTSTMASTSSSQSIEDPPSLGAIFQTAYTSNSSQSSTRYASVSKRFIKSQFDIFNSTSNRNLC